MGDYERREHHKALLRYKSDHLFEIVAGERTEIEKYYTDDVVMELPHLNVKSQGLDNQVKAVQSVPHNFKHYRLKYIAFHDCTDPDKIIYEAEADAVFRHSGQPYLQRYINIVEFRDGKICHNIEYMNMNLLSGFPPSESAQRLAK